MDINFGLDKFLEMLSYLILALFASNLGELKTASRILSDMRNVFGIQSELRKNLRVKILLESGEVKSALVLATVEILGRRSLPKSSKGFAVYEVMELLATKTKEASEADKSLEAEVIAVAGRL